MKPTIVIAAVVLGVCIAGAAVAQRSQPGVTPSPPVAYYPLECGRQPGCRIDCYQDGQIVVSRLDIVPRDTIRLAVDSNRSRKLTLLWLEIRGADDSGTETILLGNQTTCHLHELTVRPAATP